jgi:hypothetical protein
MHESTPVSSSIRPGFARTALAVGALWVLAGALFKLFLGTPADLPSPVKELPLELGVTYNLAIGAELFVVSLALLRPRSGWVLLATLFVAFEVVLAIQLARGETRCGCFGSKLSLHPAAMMAIDSAMFLALVASQPWRARSAKQPPLALAAAVAAAVVALPWFLDRELGSLTIDGQPGTPGRAWVALDLADWEGQELVDTPLARWIDPTQVPPDALWIFWRWTCEHCRDHFNRLAESERGERFLVLVRLREPVDTQGNRTIERMPEGDFVFQLELPDSLDYVIQTPGELEVREWRVVRGEEAVGQER